jgi:uncharacterized protein (DUF488 family)
VGVLYTIGHSTRALPELIGMLQDAGVTRLADVRRIPRSRRHPQFNTETLPRDLEAAGVDYIHMPALGGRRSARRGPPSRHTLWRVEAFRNYADYAETPAFQAGLAELARLATERPTAIMCAEAVWWQCHRRLITDYMLTRGWDVVHLMSPGQRQQAVLTPGAVPQRDGTIAYLDERSRDQLPWDDATDRTDHREAADHTDNTDSREATDHTENTD